MLSLLCRVLLLCVLAAAISEAEKPWTLEATIVHTDPSDPSSSASKSDVEDGVHDYTETLATLELTLDDLDFVPGRFAAHVNTVVLWNYILDIAYTNLYYDDSTGVTGGLTHGVYLFMVKFLL